VLGAGGALTAKSTPTVTAGSLPVAVAVSPDGGSVYVANLGGGVSQYDVGAGGALTAKSTPTVTAGDGPEGVAVSPNGGSVYVTNQFSNNVSQYDVGAGGALAAKSPATVTAGTNPLGVAVSPDGGSVYVANVGSGNVSQYDVGAGGALAAKSPATVPAAPAAFGIAVRPTPPPPPATIPTLIESVEDLDLPRGTENSLLKKLNGAQKNLDNGDTAGACDKLASFIDQVSAQSGKKIDSDDAADLIDEAEAVRDSLGCS
jgi:6-phosphogluconolactonase (cycloisomerase 2 family)